MIFDRNSSGWRRRVALFASVAGNQGICQLLTGLTGFLLVRVLPKEQYAWFTITSTLQAVLSALSDGGVATALMSIGGKVWQDQPRLSAVVGASLEMMTKLAFFGTLLVLPVMIYLLGEQQAPMSVIVVLIVLSICPQWMMTRTILLGVVNRLRSNVWALQLAELVLAVGRFVLTMIPLLLGWIHVLWASAAVAVAVILQGVLVRRQVWKEIHRCPAPNLVDEFRPRVRETVRQMLPSAAFNCVQGQIAIWLLSVMGTVSQVADLGALNRLSFVTNLAAAPLSLLVAPAFARCQDGGKLRRLFSTAFLGYGCFYLLLVFLSYLQAPLILSLFGPSYSHLGHELLIVTIGMALAGLNGVCWTLNLSRGWVKHLWVTIPLSILTQSCAALLLDLRTVSGAALMGVILTCGYLLHAILTTLNGFNKHARIESF